MSIRALVDTGAMFMCITREIALQLGFDVEETSTQVVTVADGRRIEVPCVAPIKISFGNRQYVTEALVLGLEPLMGVLPLEAMDLIVDPSRREVVVNPAHPHYAVTPVKRSLHRRVSDKVNS